jgi:hypothetical protein
MHLIVTMMIINVIINAYPHGANAVITPRHFTPTDRDTDTHLPKLLIRSSFYLGEAAAAESEETAPVSAPSPSTISSGVKPFGALEFERVRWGIPWW